MKKCPYCAEEIQDEATKCKHCSEWMPKYKHYPAPALRKCEGCAEMKNTQLIYFKQNMSFLFSRDERTFCGYLCFGCMTKKFAVFEVSTMLGTWWGIIGILLGPGILASNLVEYSKNALRLLRYRI